MGTNAAGSTYRSDVAAVCPLCRAELTLTVFDDLSHTVHVARLPRHPIAVFATYDRRLGVSCPASGLEIFERCDEVHSDPPCPDPSCWLEKK